MSLAPEVFEELEPDAGLEEEVLPEELLPSLPSLLEGVDGLRSLPEELDVLPSLLDEADVLPSLAGVDDEGFGLLEDGSVLEDDFGSLDELELLASFESLLDPDAAAARCFSASLLAFFSAPLALSTSSCAFLTF